MHVPETSMPSRPVGATPLRRESQEMPLLAATSSLNWIRVRRAGYSIADQALAVGGMFLANVALARTQSKEEYGIFALSYSVFTLLSGLHNAAILETYTVYGSGRYDLRFAEYARLLWRTNAMMGLGLTVTFSIIWGVLAWTKPALASPTILGLALTCGVLLTATFVRRTFYIRRRPDLAAEFSLMFFTTCAVLIWLSIRIRIFSGFYAFVIAALAWIAAGVFLGRELPGKAGSGTQFTEVEPKYWSEHWKYSRWVLVTALVFQLTSQGYYWLSAGILSVKETGDLRAMYNLLAPVDQVFVAMSLLVLQVMHILYAGKFDDVAPLLGNLALLPVVMGIGNALNDTIKAAEKPKLVFYAYLCSGGTTVLLGVPLAIHFGFRGIVYGILLSATAHTVALAAGFLWIVSSNAARRPAALARQPVPGGAQREP